MKLLVWTVVVVLGACGSEKKPETMSDKVAEPTAVVGEATNVPIAAPTTAQTAAPTKAPDNEIDAKLEAMRVVAVQACSCDEKECADTLRADWISTREAIAPEQPNMSAEQKKRYAKSLDRWLECTLGDAKSESEIRGIATDICLCDKADEGCINKAADGIGDMSKNIRIQTWVDPKVLADINGKAIQCLRDAGMKERDMIEAGVPKAILDSLKAQ